MRLEVETPHIEQSEDFYEKLFSVGDHGIIFDILRSKMYSNPILAVCREITCNARDAMREAGRGNEPIQVTLPNTLEPYYRVKDTGVGISPDRMENVFIRYGTSTKRNDDTQTGAFGLGCKSPFSVSSEFTIECVYAGIKRSYTCYIDETRTGKLALLSEIPTDQPNSTEIIIPVKSVDFRAFREGTEFVTRHWQPLPTIKGDSIYYQTPSFNLSGEGWGIASNGSYYERGTVKLIIDGIEYPLDTAQLKSYSDTSILHSIYGTIYLSFETGQLSLSASREAVHLDKRTQDAIAKKLGLVTKGLKDSAQKQVDACANLWDANIFFANELSATYQDSSFLNSLKWNGIKLTGSSISLNSDAKIYEFYRGNRRSNKIYRSSGYHIRCAKGNLLCLNDLNWEDPSAKQLEQAFDDDPSIKTLQLICLNKGGKTWEELNKLHHLDKLNPKKISDLTSNVKVRKKGGVRFLVFKFSTDHVAFRQVPYATAEEDINEKVLCFLEKDEWTLQRRIKLKEGTALKATPTFTALQALLAANPDVSVYGVDHTVSPDKIEENFPDCKSIEDFIDEKLTKSKDIDYVELEYAQTVYYACSQGFANVEAYRKIIKDPKSLYLRYMDLGERMCTLHNKQHNALKLYEDIVRRVTEKEVDKWLKDNPEKNFLALQDEVHKRYPLLSFVDRYRSDTLIEPMAHYINLMDKDAKSKEKKV